MSGVILSDNQLVTDFNHGPDIKNKLNNEQIEFVIGSKSEIGTDAFIYVI